MLKNDSITAIDINSNDYAISSDSYVRELVAKLEKNINIRLMALSGFSIENYALKNQPLLEVLTVSPARLDWSQDVGQLASLRTIELRYPVNFDEVSFKNF